MGGDSRFFVDTNVLLYSVDSSSRIKQQMAKSWLNVLWEHGAGAISWQVLHEFYVNAVRKMGSPVKKARSMVEIFTLWQPVDTSVLLVQRAWHWTDAAQVSYWDSLIVAAAERSGSRFLLTEDLQAGRQLGSVKVVNPFTTAPADCGLRESAR